MKQLTKSTLKRMIQEELRRINEGSAEDIIKKLHSFYKDKLDATINNRGSLEIRLINTGGWDSQRAMRTKEIVTVTAQKDWDDPNAVRCSLFINSKTLRQSYTSPGWSDSDPRKVEQKIASLIRQGQDTADRISEKMK